MPGTTTEATDGVFLPVDDLAKTLTYDGTFLATISVTYRDITYVKTFVNNGTAITSISQWSPSA